MEVSGIVSAQPSWQSNIYRRPNIYHYPSSSSSSCSRLSFVRYRVKFEDSDDQKKRPMQMNKSIDAMKAAKFSFVLEIMPGGVNSPVRSFKAVGGHPFVVEAGKGSKLWDRDGNEYIDYNNSWGAIIIGHADDKVNAALHKSSEKGLTFGAPSIQENVLAEMVISAVPSIEMVRFTNSGTEACMSVIRLARAYTGREKFIKFDGNYHGHGDYFLVGSGNMPDSLGVLKSATSSTLTCPYNDISAVRKLFESYPGEIAAVIVEPIGGNSGFIAPKDEFLKELRDITKKYGALLIFDEVMTGFRLSHGGAQEYYSVTPDLTTLGKIIGGGLPVGALGGRREIMEMLAPLGPVYQAGTFSGNPSTMTTGIQTLNLLKQKGTYEHLNDVTGELVEGVVKIGRKHRHAISGGSVGGMFGFFFTDVRVYNLEDAKKSHIEKFARFHKAMLEEGIYFSPSPFEALAHSFEDIERTLRAAARVFQRI